MTVADYSEMQRIELVMNDPAVVPMSMAAIVAEEIKEYTGSEEYRLLLESERYYRNRSAVQEKQNKIAQRSNTKLEHPLVYKLVRQKANYTLSKPFSVVTENKRYGDALNKVFNKAFRRKLKNMGKAAVKNGISWELVSFNSGKMVFTRIPARELRPLWEDSEKTKLWGFIRFYIQVEYSGNRKGQRYHAELWNRAGVQRFIGKWAEGEKTPPLDFDIDTTFGSEATGYVEPHFYFEDRPVCFEEVPVIWLRYNEDEIPLHYFIKELVDDINFQKSITADVLRDIVNVIYKLKNYGGADLGEFLKDLQEHLAVKVDADGDVDTLKSDLNIEAVLEFIKRNRRDAIYYADGVDTEDADLGNASGVAIQYRYTDLDNDCQDIGNELQETFERLKLFIDVFLEATGVGNFHGEEFEVIFNMDMPVAEGEVITNIRNSTDLSLRTRLENHPFVKDVDDELDRITKEKAENMAAFGMGLFDGAFGVNNPPPPAGEDKPGEGKAGGDRPAAVGGGTR